MESVVVGLDPLTQAVRVILAPVALMPGLAPVPRSAAMSGTTNAIKNGLRVPTFNDSSGAGAAGAREGFTVGNEV